MPLHDSIIGNFIGNNVASFIVNVMVYKDRPETNLLQLIAHPQNSYWFSTISAIVFEVKVVAAQKQA